MSQGIRPLITTTDRAFNDQWPYIQMSSSLAVGTTLSIDVSLGDDQRDQTIPVVVKIEDGRSQWVPVSNPASPGQLLGVCVVGDKCHVAQTAGVKLRVWVVEEFGAGQDVIDAVARAAASANDDELVQLRSESEAAEAALGTSLQTLSDALVAHEAGDATDAELAAAQQEAEDARTALTAAQALVDEAQDTARELNRGAIGELQTLAHPAAKFSTAAAAAGYSIDPDTQEIDVPLNGSVGPAGPFGVGAVPIMHQDVTGGANGLFTADQFASVNAGSADPLSELKYSNHAAITDDYRDVDGRVRYGLHYSEVIGNGGEDVLHVYKQGGALGDTSVTDYELISSTLASNNFIGFVADTPASSALDGNGGTNWWWAIGIRAFYVGNTIPVDNTNGAPITAKKVTLYALPLTEAEKEAKLLAKVATPCAIAKFITGGYPKIYLVMAHEGDGGTSMVVHKNGVPVTYQNLVNGTDAGDGRVNFASGGNGNFNRRASTVEFLQYPGDEIVITKPATPRFDGEHAILTTDPAALADSATGVWRWFWNETTWFLRNPENEQVDGARGVEDGEYKARMTLAGFDFFRNDELIHSIECEWEEFSLTANAPASAFIADGVNADAAPPWEGLVSMPNGVTEVIPTGVDLSTVEEMHVTFGRTNGTWGQVTESFRPAGINLGIPQGKLLGHFGDTYLSIFEMTAEQFAAGDIPFRANTGQTGFGFEVSRIEFKKRAVVEEGRELLFTGVPVNTGSTVTLDSATWQEVVDRYESIVVNTTINGTGYTNLIDTSRIVDGNNIAGPLNANVHFSLSSLNYTDGDFGFATTNNSSNAEQVEIWGVLPHGRVSSLPAAGASTVSVENTPAFDSMIAAQIALEPYQTYLLTSDSSVRFRRDTGGLNAVATLPANNELMNQGFFQDQFGALTVQGQNRATPTNEFQVLLANVPYDDVPDPVLEIGGEVQQDLLIGVITDAHDDGTYTHLLYGLPGLLAWRNWEISTAPNSLSAAGNDDASVVSLFVE